MRAVAAIALAALAGCGSGHSTARGRAVFVRACSGCHTVTGHDTGASGGDLRVAHLRADDVASFVAVMPVDPPLGRADTAAVARYVASR